MYSDHNEGSFSELNSDLLKMMEFSRTEVFQSMSVVAEFGLAEVFQDFVTKYIDFGLLRTSLDEGATVIKCFSFGVKPNDEFFHFS